MGEPSPKVTGDKAFSACLDRSLREQFAAVMLEPVPQELRDLIEGTAEVPEESCGD